MRGALQEEIATLAEGDMVLNNKIEELGEKIRRARRTGSDVNAELARLLETVNNASTELGKNKSNSQRQKNNTR
jgi:hypothetical protein